jgi:predicted N-acetyltransferase YhbS
VEYTIRPARITDIDRLAAIGRSAMTVSDRGSLDAADLLRQCVYLPHASVLVAEARRELVGGALLVLRPSVTAGGYVGAVDFLVVAPDHDADRVTESLLEELLRSASNKGCSTVEASVPSDPADLARLERAGFAPAGVTLRRPVLAAGSGARRT